MSRRPRSTFQRKLPFDVVRVDALRSEPRDDDASVGGRRGAGVGRLDVTLARAARLRGRRAPTRSCRCACRSRRASSVARERSSDASPSPYRPGLNVAFGIAADGAGHEDPVAPDDRARVREAGNRRAPQDVLALGAVPAIGKILSVGDARRLRRRGTTASCRPPAPPRESPRASARRSCTILRSGTITASPARPPLAAVEDHPPRRAGVGRRGRT